MKSLSIFISLIITVAICGCKTDNYSKSCLKDYSFNKETNRRVIVDPPPPFSITLYLLYRNDYKGIPTTFTPKTDTENGIFYMNLCKSILNGNPFEIKQAKHHIEYCIKACPVLHENRRNYNNRYKSKIQESDSLFWFLHELNREANTMENLNFETGCLIEIISGFRFDKLNTKLYDNLYHLRFSIAEFCQIKDSSIITTENQKILNHINQVFDRMDEKPITPTYDSDSNIVTLKNYIADSIYLWSNINSFNKIIEIAKKGRNQLIHE